MGVPTIAIISLMLSLSGAARAADLSGGLPGALTIVTYNVLEKHDRGSERLPALMRELAAAHADVYAFEEATPWFAAALFAESWATGLYRSSDPAQMAGQLLLLSRWPLVNVHPLPLPSCMKRVGLVAELAPGGHPLRIGLGHLDCHLEDGAFRARQLRAMFAELGAAEDSILLGDFNFGDGAPESAALDPAYRDLWTLLHPGQPGFTWDIERSAMAKVGSFAHETSRRLDRILIRSGRWHATGIDIIGDRPVKEGDRSLFPSDHFGLRAVLTAAP